MGYSDRSSSLSNFFYLKKENRQEGRCMNIDIERVNEMNHAHHCYDEVHQSVCSAPTHSCDTI